MSQQEHAVPIVPHNNDILMGRGGKNNQHTGNNQLRAMARQECRNYSSSSKKGKSHISRELVRRVREMDPPGRFLKKNNDSGLWEDVGDDVAREKASQALRDAVAIVMNEEHGDIDDHDEEEEEEVHVEPIPAAQAFRRSTSAPPIMDKSPTDERRKTWPEPPQQQRRQSEHHTTPYHPPVTPSTRQHQSSSSSKRRRYYENTTGTDSSPWMGFHPPVNPPYASPDHIASSRSYPEFSHRPDLQPSRSSDFQPSRSFPTQQMRRPVAEQHPVAYHHPVHRAASLDQVEDVPVDEFDLFNGQLLEPEEEKSLERRSDTF
jgi:hypothetical protein